MRILITGANGRLGSKLVEVATSRAHDITATDQEMLNITDLEAARTFMRGHAPEWVIHCAAWTDVDGCARDPEAANRINGYGAGNIALAAHEVGAGIVYVSSNEVFDGEATTPYHENAPTRPINPYGYSKWLGESEVQKYNPRHMIARTSWLFAHGGKNFIQTILNAAAAQKPLRVVTDESANPTYTDDLAEALMQLVEAQASGIYHLVNEGYCSRWEFARYILDHAGYRETELAQITSNEWARPSTPPRFSPLENQAAAALGVKLRGWQAAVDAFLKHEALYKA